jgi:hypothetical protein
LIEELLNYTFVLDKEGRPTKTPKDGKDHGITALEFVVAELPHNLQELRLSAYIPQGTKFIHDKQIKQPVVQRPKLYNPLEVQDVNSNNSKYYSTRSDYYTTTNGEVFETEEDYEDYGGSCILSAYIPK